MVGLPIENDGKLVVTAPKGLHRSLERVSALTERYGASL